MTKKEIQKRITKQGKPIALNAFCWDNKTKTVSTKERDYVFNFDDLSGCTFNTESGCTFNTWSDCTFNTGSECTFNTWSDCTFNTGSDCTFKTWSDCTFKTGSDCTFNTWSDCTFNTWSGCTFNTGSDCTFNTESGCTFKTGSGCTFNTGSDCTFNTESGCTFNTWSGCTFKTGPGCTFNTGPDCTFKTGSGCTFKTGSDCTFKTGSGCTFNTESGCTFNTGSDCVIVRRDIFEVITLKSETELRLAPYQVPGYVSEGVYSVTGKSAIIADGILSEIISKKGPVCKVKNYGENTVSYLIEKDGLYSHGATIKEAKESLVYKIGNRDTSIYNNYTLNTVLTTEEAIKLYRVITGACESGTKYFVSNLKNAPQTLSVSDLIKLTDGQYNNGLLVDFFRDKVPVEESK